jgi:Tol biopolymer transport system component
MSIKYRSVLFIVCLVITIVAGACSKNIASTTSKPSASAENTTVTPPVSTTAKPAEKAQPEVAKPANQPKIVFWSKPTQGSSYDIYIMDPDGQNQVALTHNAGNNLVPRLSPDGTKIVFASDRSWAEDGNPGGNYNIFEMDTDGSNVRNLTGNKTWASMPSWSPDGRMIVFVNQRPLVASGVLPHDIWVMDSAGNYFLELYKDNELSPDWPTWSPDGTKILITSNSEMSYAISMMTFDYDQIRQLVLSPQPENISKEIWSKTGNRKIVSGELQTVTPIENPLVRGVKKLNINYAGGDYGGDWSPDGKKTAYDDQYTDVNTKIPDIFIMNSDGSNPVNLTDSINPKKDKEIFDWPSWSPDGKKIAFVIGAYNIYDRTKDQMQIYEMNADGTNVIEIPSNNYSSGSPDWGTVPSEMAERIKSLQSQSK